MITQHTFSLPAFHVYLPVDNQEGKIAFLPDNPCWEMEMVLLSHQYVSYRYLPLSEKETFRSEYD